LCSGRHISGAKSKATSLVLAQLAVKHWRDRRLSATAAAARAATDIDPQVSSCMRRLSRKLLKGLRAYFSDLGKIRTRHFRRISQRFQLGQT
jgi:hypothetical protein